jgi:hypothetical protein
VLILGGGGLIWYVISSESGTPEDNQTERNITTETENQDDNLGYKEDDTDNSENNFTDTSEDTTEDAPEEEDTTTSPDTTEDTEENEPENDTDIGSDVLTGDYSSFSIDRYDYGPESGVFKLNWEITKDSGEELGILEQLNENELTLTFANIKRDSMIKWIKENSEDGSCSEVLADEWLTLDTCNYNETEEQSTYTFTLGEGREYNLSETEDKIVLSVQ